MCDICTLTTPLPAETVAAPDAFTEALSIILRFEERGQTSAARMLLLADIQKVVEERNESIDKECVCDVVKGVPFTSIDDGYPV